MKSLPFWKKSEAVVELVIAGKGVVVMPTGTGKTTQTPQLLHEFGYTANGQMIYISVPKRVLAVELATRVAQEMNVSLGDLVGYEIRGEKRISKATRITFMTEGVLRGKIRSNPKLDKVSVILFDEFHQRSLMSDFNVALVERAQQEGSKVAFLLMSATADATALTEHFQCGLVDGSDLTTVYPITQRYVGEQGTLFDQAASEVATLVATHGQKVNGLVFMPGKAEIEMCISALQKLNLSGVTILPLHGDLDGEARHAPFETRSGVTITVATDIVETGATLPNIGWVVDSGLAREIGYDPMSDTSSLGVVEIAQDRLTQRRGRCGRVMAGEYVGLFSRENKEARSAKTQPEILRKPLREVVLTIKALGLSRAGQPLRMIDNPPKDNWKEAKRQLQMLGFVDETPEAKITSLGYKAVELGCDPRDAAMLFRAAELGCVQEMAIAIAARGTRLFIRPKNVDERSFAQAAHANFRTSRVCDSWAAVKAVRAAQNRGAQSLGGWCKQNYISYRTLQEVWNDVRQLLRAAANFGCEINEEEGLEENLCKAICAGLPDRTFSYFRRPNWYEQENGDISAALGKESVIVPATGNIVAWEMIEVTSTRGPMKLITNAVAVPK